MTYAAIAPVQRVRSAAGRGFYPALLGLGAAPVLAANGGFFPTSWGWAGGGLAWAAVLGAALGEPWRPSRLELAYVGGLALFAAWIAASIAWTTTESGTMLELERTLVYVAGALAAVTLVRPAQVRLLVGGLCTGLGLVCLYALTTRLFPNGNLGGNVFAGSRLSTPVGYWNGLGLVAAMGSLLAVTAAARSESLVARAAAAASVPLFATTLYFTFSRGAWIGLLAGLAVLFVVDRQRVQLLATSLPTVLLTAYALWRASHEQALTHTSSAALHTAVGEGRSLGVTVGVLCLAAGCVALASRWVDPVWERPRVLWPARAVIVVAAVAVVAAGLVRFGSPVTMARHGYDSFTSSQAASTNLNSRLFSLSNDGRIGPWKVAWHAFRDHPVGGVGPGGFLPYWNQHRPSEQNIQDAHSLYIETLGEAGAVGLAILVAALLVPFAAAWRARRNPLAAGALGAYTAFLVHAGADWDWELAGVTLTAVLCGAAVLAAARGEGTSDRWRWPLLGIGSVVAVLALVGLAGNLLVAASAHALNGGNVPRAATDARRATQLAPWSAAAWRGLGKAQLALGRRREALASLRTAAARDSHDSGPWIDLALASSGAEQKAALDRAQQLDPRNSSIADLRSQLGAK